MDDTEPNLGFDDLGGDSDELEEQEADTGLFYWALKGALERTRIEPPPTHLS